MSKEPPSLSLTQRYGELEKFANFVSVKKRSNTHSSVRCLFFKVRCFFQQISELCVQKSMKNTIRNLRKVFPYMLPRGSIAYCTVAGLLLKHPNTASTLSYNQARSGLYSVKIILLANKMRLWQSYLRFLKAS